MPISGGLSSRGLMVFRGCAPATPPLQRSAKKPVHVGFCISCYTDGSFVFSVPISASRTQVRAHFKRDLMIGGESLTKDQVELLRQHVIGDVEIGWDDHLTYELEGHNLPGDDSEWV